MAEAVQMKGLGSALWCFEVLLDGSLEISDALEDATTDASSVIRPKKRSTWLIQDADVGVKCNWKRLGEPCFHLGS